MATTTALLTPAGRTRYSWEFWADGRVHLLERGLDFISTAALRKAAHMHATRRGLVASVSEVDDGVVELLITEPGRAVLPPAEKRRLHQYDWGRFALYVEHRLREGIDYAELTLATSALVRYASRRNLRATTRQVGGGFAFTLAPA